MGLICFSGITDAAIMPLLALLVDTRHVALYGSVYAIAQLAVCLAYGLGNLYTFLISSTTRFYAMRKAYKICEPKSIN